MINPKAYSPIRGWRMIATSLKAVVFWSENKSQRLFLYKGYEKDRLHSSIKLLVHSNHFAWNYMNMLACFWIDVEKETAYIHSNHTALPGEIAVLICLEAEYICFTKGIRLINCSPSQKTVEPSHDEANIPTKKVKSTDVINPSPATYKNEFKM